MHRTLIALLVGATIGLTPAGVAGATTVSLRAEPVDPHPDNPYVHGPARYELVVEGSAENDQLSIGLTAPYGGNSPGPPSSVSVAALGDTQLTPGVGCTRSQPPPAGAADRIECAVTDPLSSFTATIMGGGGDDRLDVSTVSNTSVTVHGGPGDDWINANGGDVYGDAGDDLLQSYGAAHLFGGPGRDRFYARMGSPATEPPAEVTADDDRTSDLVTCGYYAATPPITLGPSDVSVLCGPLAARRRTPPEIPAGVTATPVRRTGDRAPALRIMDPGRSDDTGEVSALIVACSDDVKRWCDVRVTVRRGGRTVGSARRLVAPGNWQSFPVSFTTEALGRRLQRRPEVLTYLASMRDVDGRVRTDRLDACTAGPDKVIPADGESQCRGR